MKHKLKNYLKLGTLLLGIIAIAISCTNDDNEKIITKHEKRIPNFRGYKLPADSVFRVNQTLKNHIIERFGTETEYSSRTLTSENYGFSIDTSFVQLLASDSIQSFTFMVEREEPVENVLENYVLTLYGDQGYTQMLASYPIIEGADGNDDYDLSNATVQFIDDSSLVSRGVGCDNFTEEIIEWDESAGECIPYNCGGETGNGQHGPNDACDATGNDQAGYECTGGWVVTGCINYGYGPGGGSGTGGGGGSNGNNNDPPDDEEEEETIPVVPFDNFGQKRECRKITNLLNDPLNSSFKQKLLDLANPANYSSNLDIEFEKYSAIHENESTLQTLSGNNSSPSVNISYTTTHPNKTWAFIHTHPNNTQGTYSVFSFEDLIAISQILASNKINTGTFVAFLITKKGDNLTYYAMTIHNKTKFEDFFYYYNDTNFNINTATQAEKDKRTNSFNKAFPLRDEYYDSSMPKINNFNINSEQMLTEFLSFMGEADLGATMFETDENFESFEKVIPGGLGGGLIRKSCNN